jgi:hypothetical protein
VGETKLDVCTNRFKVNGLQLPSLIVGAFVRVKNEKTDFFKPDFTWIQGILNDSFRHRFPWHVGVNFDFGAYLGLVAHKLAHL